MSELAKTEFDLTPARYRKVEKQSVNHDSPKQIIDQVLTVEEEIESKLKSLRGQVK